MGYKNELVKSMEWLAEKPDTIFLGQSIPINSLKPAIKNSKINNYWFRIHVGLEAKEDLINDLKFAIEKYEEK